MNAQDQEDFREYVAARSAALMRTAYLLTGQTGEAEDLLQLTLAKTYASWGRRDRGDVDRYVRRIMVNTERPLWRRRKVSRELVAAPPERTDGLDSAADLVLHEHLWAAVQTLPSRQRAILVLRFYEGLSEAEIATTLGVSAGTVKSATSRALARLRNAPRMGTSDATQGACA